MIRIEGFFDEVIGSGPHGFDRHGHIAMSGDEHHRQVRVKRVDAPQQGQAVLSFQLNVGNYAAFET